jgi:C-terminal processing protease CtpA/Prc
VILDQELKTLQWTGSDSLDQELLLQFFTRQLRQAGDRHSHRYSRRAITTALQNLVPEEPTGMYIGGNIGLISVPAYGSFDTAQDVDYANNITRAVRLLDSKEKINGWIIDLRQNHGGSMWPMLAGFKRPGK